MKPEIQELNDRITTLGDDLQKVVVSMGRLIGVECNGAIDKDAELDVRNKLIFNLQNALAEAQDKVEALEAEGANAELILRNKIILDLQEQVAAHEKSHDKLTRQTVADYNTIAEANNQIGYLKDKLVVSNLQIAELQEKNTAQTYEIGGLRAELLSCKKTIDVMSAEGEKDMTRIVNLQKRVSDLGTDNQRLLKQASADDERLSAANCKINDLHKELDEKRKALDDWEKRSALENVRFVALTDEHIVLKQKLRQLRDIMG